MYNILHLIFKGGKREWGKAVIINFLVEFQIKIQALSHIVELDNIGAFRCLKI
jgi:hypothetical protein